MKSNERRVPKRWTEEEDWILHEETEKQAAGNTKDWHRIAAKLPGRTNKDCRKRWVNKVCGGLKKGAWNTSEDGRLLKAVQKHGQKWTLVANEVGFRSPDQCAKRWQLKLDPNLEHRGWTVEEDELLSRLVQEHGREWKLFQEQNFPGKSTNELKNRYCGLARKAKSAYSRAASVDSCVSSTSSNSYSDDGADDHDAPVADPSRKVSVVASPVHQGAAADLTAEWMRTFDDPSMWIDHFNPTCNPVEGEILPDKLYKSTKVLGMSNTGPEFRPIDVTQWPDLVCNAEIATSWMATPGLEGAMLTDSSHRGDGIDNVMGDILLDPMQRDRDSTDENMGLPIDSSFNKVMLTIDGCDRATCDIMLNLAKSHKGKSKIEIN